MEALGAVDSALSADKARLIKGDEVDKNQKSV
jgi:hypothetical protein